MRNPPQLGEVIAERKLSVSGDTEPHITVRMGKPRPLIEIFNDGVDNGDMYCPFRIVGVGDEKIGYAAGIDAIQAMQLVMKAIRIELDRLARQGIELRWEGDEHGDLGFPSVDSVR